MKKVSKSNSVTAIPYIKDDRQLRKLSANVRQANKDATKAVTQVYANNEWEHLKCKDFKEWTSKFLPDYSYDAVRARAEAGLISYELSGDWTCVGVYSQSAMRCFRCLDRYERKKVWAYLKNEHLAEYDDDHIIGKWLTATRVEQAKLTLFGSIKEQDERVPKTQLFDLDATSDDLPIEESQSAQVPNSGTESNSEDDVVDDDDIENEEFKHQDVVQINKPSDISAKQQHSIARFKNLLDSFDGEGTVGKFLIEKVVEEYFNKYDNIDKVIAKTAKKRLEVLQRQAMKSAANGNCKGGAA